VNRTLNQSEARGGRQKRKPEVGAGGTIQVSYEKQRKVLKKKVVGSGGPVETSMVNTLFDVSQDSERNHEAFASSRNEPETLESQTPYMARGNAGSNLGLSKNSKLNDRPRSRASCQD
jgi:hypothetical protein